MASDGDLYSQYNINQEYDDPSTYGEQASFYDEGRYPPDWPRRREAVWERQRYRCARCGIYKSDASGAAVHHVDHLANGGSNKLANLAGLCYNCHSLMHPENTELNGDHEQADVFPSRNADERVAVVKWPNENDELKADLENLAATSSAGENTRAITSATVETSAHDAQRASADLPLLLQERGYVPRTSPYHTIMAKPVLTGFKGLVSTYDPTVELATDANTWETAERVGKKRKILLTDDATKATFKIIDGAGDSTIQTIEISEPEQYTTYKEPISPPPLSIYSLPRYIGETLFSATLTGIVPAILATLLRPELLPTSNLISGFVIFMLVFGLALLAVIAGFRAGIRALL